jgi:hypothetical protein
MPITERDLRAHFGRKPDCIPDISRAVARPEYVP